MNTSATRARTGGHIYGINSANNWKHISRIHQSLVRWVHEDPAEKDFAGRNAVRMQMQDVARHQLELQQDRISDQICVVSGKNEVFYVTNGTAIMNFALVDRKEPAAGIQVMRTLDVARDLDKKEREWGLLLHPTCDGQLAVVSAHSIRIVDSSLSRTLSVLRFPEELITRNVTVDECGGIYIVSDAVLRKIIWTGSRLSPFEKDGAWSSPYDSRDNQALKTNAATAPVLMGTGNDSDKLVVIADVADNRKLVAFWRDSIPAAWNKLPDAGTRRIAGHIPISCGLNTFNDADQSVVVHDYGAFVLSKSSSGYQSPGSIADNAGVERFEWNPASHRWISVWTRNDVLCKGVVPTVDASLGIVFLNSYTNGAGYPVMGMDWHTGETVC